MGVRSIRHDGDCSIWALGSHICDCGALREAVRGDQADKHDLWSDWGLHQIAIARASAKSYDAIVKEVETELKIKDRVLPSPRKSPVERSPLKVASYSLFGNHVSHGTRQFYWDHIPALVRAHHNIYPGWQLRIHVDSTYAEDRSAQLRRYAAAGLVNIVPVEENIACCRSMLWRMLPIWDPEVAFVICRDIDSLPIPRDWKCVQQWIETGSAIHTINDNPQHSVAMMGGMVGFRSDTFLDSCPWGSWKDMIESHEGLDQATGGYDQILMSHSIWSHYKPDACAHRFSGRMPDDDIDHCFTELPEYCHPNLLGPEMTAKADALMPYLGAASYDIPAAIKFFDTHGLPDVKRWVSSAEP